MKAERGELMAWFHPNPAQVLWSDSSAGRVAAAALGWVQHLWCL